MNNSYGIKVFDGMVQVFDLAQREHIKNNGEQVWLYEKDGFWDFFRKKIAYDGESLSFLILTDQQDLPIPTSILLSQKNAITRSAYDAFVGNAYEINIITKPHVSFQSKPVRKMTKTAKTKKVDFFTSTENAAAAYYREKTEEYEGIGRSAQERD